MIFRNKASKTEKFSFSILGSMFFLVAFFALLFFTAVWRHPSTTFLPLHFLRTQSFIDVYDTSGMGRGKRTTGVSWADYDNDGNLDLFVGSARTKLYRNNGDGTFVDVTAESGLNFRDSFVFAGAFGDYNNDGCPDLFVAKGGKEYDTLYQNTCDGIFHDVTEFAGFADFFQESYQAASAAWADYDNDGFLDLYAASNGLYVPAQDSSLFDYGFQPNILYHNRGDGTFLDVTDEAGVNGLADCGLPPVKPPFVRTILKEPLKSSFQPLWFDYNSDGRSDLFVATDFGVSPLYKNNGNGTFTNVTKEAGLCRYGSNMGAAAGDYDNDGDMDLYTTNVGANYFWRNNGNGTLSEVAAEIGVADHRSIGWGAGFFDYDNDGDLDLYVANGTVYVPRGVDVRREESMDDKLYENLGNGKFSEVGLQGGISGDDSKRATAFGDYNNDGFEDIFVASAFRATEDKSRLYQNRGNRNHWLTVQLVGVRSNRDGVGARISVTSDGKTQLREVVSGTSFLSQNSLWQTFGLGSAKQIDIVAVKWPSGILQVLREVGVNQKLVIVEE